MSRSFPELSHTTREPLSVMSMPRSDITLREKMIERLAKRGLQQSSPLSTDEALHLGHASVSHPNEFQSQEKDLARNFSDPALVSRMTLQEYSAFLSPFKDEYRAQLIGGLVVNKQLEKYPLAMQYLCQYVLENRTEYELLVMDERHRVANLLFKQDAYLHVLSAQTDMGSLVALCRYHVEQETEQHHWSSEQSLLYFWSFLSPASKQVRATLYSLFSSFLKQGYFKLDTVFVLLGRGEIRAKDFLEWVESEWAYAREALEPDKGKWIEICPEVRLMYQSSELDSDAFLKLLCRQSDEGQERQMIAWRPIAHLDIPAITTQLISIKGGRSFFEWLRYQGNSELPRNIQIAFLVESLLHHTSEWTLHMLQELAQWPGNLFESVLEKVIHHADGNAVRSLLLTHLDGARLVKLASLDIVRGDQELVAEMARVFFSQWSLAEQRKLRSTSKDTFDLLQQAIVTTPSLFLLVKDFRLISPETFFRALYGYRFIEDKTQWMLLAAHLNTVYPYLRGFLEKVANVFSRFVRNRIGLALFPWRHRQNQSHFRITRYAASQHFLSICSRKTANRFKKALYASLDFLFGDPSEWFEKEMQRGLRRERWGTSRVFNRLGVNPTLKRVSEMGGQAEGDITQEGNGLLAWTNNGRPSLNVNGEAASFSPEVSTFHGMKEASSEAKYFH